MVTSRRRRRSPATDPASDYHIEDGRIFRTRVTRDGTTEVPLTNWSARIVEEVVHDDGSTERRSTFAIEGTMADGTPLPRIFVPAADFSGMRWPLQEWGPGAVVFPGQSGHLRAALQLLSGTVPRRTVYAHTGWRQIGGHWVYLHAGGGIGEHGVVAGVEVELPDSLRRYVLPSPPSVTDRFFANCVRASLRILDLGPDHITVPVLAAIFRAALSSADYSIHLAGRTGVYKSELAALAQQHFGAGMDARNLPGGWSSTANALEALAFAAKDSVLVVDDFAPTGTTADAQRLHREADRLLRGQGNSAGRQRMRSNGLLRPGHPPRGTILSTGEDIPRGQSLRARMLVIEISPGDLGPAPPAQNESLSQCQRDASRGRYAKVMASFLAWLAPRYSTVLDRLGDDRAALRDRAMADARGDHARTPGIIADLALGLRYFLDFAKHTGAITATDRNDLDERCWRALREVAARQVDVVRSADPTELFLRLVAGTLATGDAHIAHPDGREPRDARAWGWRPADGQDDREESDWVSRGRRIGWVDGNNVYLEPAAAFAVAQDLGRRQGESLSISARTLWRRLHERCLIESRDERRERSTIRRTLEGVRDREVLHLSAETVLRRTETVLSVRRA